MFKGFLNRQINSLTVAAALVALSSLASRFLGIVRDRILAGRFGAGEVLDVYYAAFRIPDLIFNLIVLGALSAGFIPVFSALIKNGESSAARYEDNRPAWDLVNNVINILALSLAALSLVGIIFSRPLTAAITPGFAGAQQDLTITLTRIMFLSPFFLGISGIFGGVLQSFKRFLIYSLAPIFYNLGIIIGALLFVDRLGVVGLAWGVVLGAAMHMLVQLPAAKSLGYRYRCLLNFRDSATLQIAKMMGPRTLSLAISQINLVVITAIASSLSSGSLAVFNLANNLQSFPVGIFGISFAIAAFPALSASAFEVEKLTERFSQAMRQILFFMIPATVLMLALRAQIIRLILGSGNFNWRDTIMTMDAFGFFALSLFAQATIPLLVRVFYARHNSRTPFYFGLASAIVNIALSYIFAPRLGVAGLALAFSIANILNFLLLWIWLYFRIGALDIGRILSSVVKTTVAAIAAGIAAQVMKGVIWPFIDMTKFSGVLAQFLVSAGSGVVVFAFFCYLLRSEEMFGFFDSLRRRWPFRKVEVGDSGEARGL